MTLLTALREHPDAMEKREYFLMSLPGGYGGRDLDRFDAYDRALVTACLQEAARRTRKAAECPPGYAMAAHVGSRTQKIWMDAADFLDQMANQESAE